MTTISSQLSRTTDSFPDIQFAFQVLIQGNQVSLVESLLTGQEYKIPRKYLKGLENAPKSKRKGR